MPAAPSSRLAAARAAPRSPFNPPHRCIGARVLPEQYRLHNSRDFHSVVRSGRRAGGRNLVIYVANRAPETGPPALIFGGPRFGLIVSKSVGGSVVRHTLARRLRPLCVDVAPGLDRGSDVVIRALPPAAVASATVLERDLRRALQRLGVVGGA
ncbi:ribonuclease P protein component [Smaragdicoccus niigatensis]|uniref:ribonuclease P protein component n=1 Tax=Smaragdicoccus niigatensis TaxID=359359 RepID=UPI00278C4F94|nr:ribonuclease P protein component [Smaragdicoccus niigatensis]